MVVSSLMISFNYDWLCPCFGHLSHLGYSHCCWSANQGPLRKNPVFSLLLSEHPVVLSAVLDPLCSCLMSAYLPLFFATVSRFGFRSCDIWLVLCLSSHALDMSSCFVTPWFSPVLVCLMFLFLVKSSDLVCPRNALRLEWFSVDHVCSF